jgi:hypothetical protein
MVLARLMLLEDRMMHNCCSHVMDYARMRASGSTVVKQKPKQKAESRIQNSEARRENRVIAHRDYSSFSAAMRQSN